MEPAETRWTGGQPLKIYGPEMTFSGKEPLLTPYLTEDPAEHDAVLIFPGGGYDHVTVLKEGRMVAEALNTAHLNAFVLDYRAAPSPRREILSDAVRAVQFLRCHMGKEPFFGSRLALMGFSAGGHLALMEAEHWREIRTGNDAVSEMNGRPDALILAYPVVTFCGPCAHSRSRENFLGAEDAGNEMLAVKYSAEKAVGADLPPVFLWHCEGDASVPVGNSLMLRDELERSGVLHRLRIYPEGAHGLGLAQDNTEVRGWFTDCIDWLHGLGIH